MKDQSSEYHLVTAHGRVALITNDRQRAVKRWEEVGRPIDWKINQVVTTSYDVTPPTMNRHSKSAALKLVAEREGIPIIDIKISA